MTGRRFVVYGEVQGVGFRWFVLRHAERLGLRGWVRNRQDGCVEAEAFGPPEALGRLQAFLDDGPANAVVTNVEMTEISDEVVAVSGFKINP